MFFKQSHFDFSGKIIALWSANVTDEQIASYKIDSIFQKQM